MLFVNTDNHCEDLDGYDGEDLGIFETSYSVTFSKCKKSYYC